METSQEVLDYVARLPIGAHAGLFYENGEVAAEVFSALVKGGIDSSEWTVLISDSVEDLKHFAGLPRGTDPRIEHTGFLSLSDFCFDEQHLSWKKAKDKVKGLIGDVDGLHVKGIRAIVLADQCLKRTTRDEMMRFEKEWGSSLQLPLSVMCCYDMRNLADPNWEDFFLGLCKVHGHLVFRGLAASKT